MKKQSSDDFYSGTHSYDIGSSTDPSWLEINTPSSGGRPGANNRPDYWQFEGMTKDPERGYYNWKSELPRNNKKVKLLKKLKPFRSPGEPSESVDPIGESPRNPDTMHNDDYSSTNPYDSSNYSGIVDRGSKNEDLSILDKKRYKKRKFRNLMDPNDEVNATRNDRKFRQKWYDIGNEVGMSETLNSFDSGSVEENMNYSGVDRTASVIDVDREHLDLKIWDKENDEYKIKKQVRNFILTKLYDTFVKLNLKSFVRWIKDVYIIGSMVSYRWVNESDIDVHIIIDQAKLKKEEKYLDTLKDFTKKLRLINRDINIPGTNHILEFTIGENYEKNTDGIYSLIDNNWIKKPQKEEIKKEFKDIFEKAYTEALKIIISVSTILESVKLQLKDYKYYHELLNEDDIDKEKINKSLIKIQKEVKEDLARVLTIYKIVKEGRKSAYLDKKDPAYSEENMVYKILEHYAYITLFKNIKVFLEMKNPNNQFKYIDKIVSGKKGFVKKSYSLVGPSVNPISGPDKDNNTINTIYPHKNDYKPQEKNNLIFDRIKSIWPLYKKTKDSYDNRTTDKDRQFEKYHDMGHRSGPTYVDRNWFGGSGTNILTMPSSANGGWSDGY